MEKINKKASSALLIVIVIFIAMTIWYIVLNKTTSLTRDIWTWKEKQEILEWIYKKWNIALEAVRKYNSNAWAKFWSTISCPEEWVIFYKWIKSWSAWSWGWEMETQTWKLDNIVLVSNGTDYFCSGTTEVEYIEGWHTKKRLENIKIYFSSGAENNSYFSKIEKWAVLKDLTLENKKIEKYNSIWTGSIGSSQFVSCNKSNLIDGNEDTFCYTEGNGKYKDLTVIFSPFENIEHIVLKKPEKYDFSYNYGFKFEDGSTEISSTKHFAENETEQILDLDLKTFRKNKKVVGFIIRTKTPFDNLAFSELEFYVFKNITSDYSFTDEFWVSFWEENRWGKWELVWVSSGRFPDINPSWLYDVKKIVLKSSRTMPEDEINDNFNSDNYMLTSSSWVYYPKNIIDDDSFPRTAFFWDIKSDSSYYNIFWNNYKANQIIENNPNNNDNIYLKWSSSTWALLKLDINTNTHVYDYNLKLVVFDEAVYKNQNKLLVNNVYFWSGITQKSWFLNINPSTKDLTISSSGTIFNLKDENFALFLKNNHKTFPIAYKLTAESESWKTIYINPIDDSKSDIIEVLANHIIRTNNKKYIWKNKKVVWNK